jgi:phosphoglycerol transferase MdoB-like AlkP superfamily enzyme
MLAGITFIITDLVSEWFFWAEFGSRFNFIMIDYLVYSREVVGVLTQSYPLHLIIPAIALASIALALLLFRAMPAELPRLGTSALSTRARLGSIALLALLLTSGWSALIFGPCMAGENRYIGEVGSNGICGLVSAFRANILEYDHFYQTCSREAAFNRIRSRLGLKAPADGRVETAAPIRREIISSKPETHANVIIVVVESLSAKFLDSYGSEEDLTPNLDALSRESLLFTNCYATGTRTVRGLEAITLSVPPTPGRSIIKRPDQPLVFNIGQIFAKRGYRNAFMYGGYGYFDNMNSFFAKCGFDIVDESCFNDDDVTFSNIFGVCDGDLLTRVLKESNKSYMQGQPFFTLVMTTSNHRPYTFPATPGIPPEGGRRSAVMYTDHAIGQFMAQAKQQPWYSNTVFIIVADHCHRSAGRTDLPVSKYHIPLIVHCPALIKPQECSTLCSQMDLAPTLLGLLNTSYTSEFFGRDVLTDPPNRALIGTYQLLGLYANDHLTVLAPGRKVRAYNVSPEKRQHLISPDQEEVLDAISIYQTAGYHFSRKRYKDR